MSRAGRVSASRITERVLAVLAAFCVVAAFTLAMMWPVMTTLDDWLAMTNQNVLIWLRIGVRATLSDWTWRTLFQPVLGRPCWLLPLTLGLIFGGAALSVASRRGVPNTPRWRD